MSDTRSSWTGWAVFAGIVLIITGAIDALLGLTAVLLPASIYVVPTGGSLLLLDVAGWGWWHLIFGLVLVLVGIFVIRGAGWARWTAVVLVAINAVSHFALIPAQPLWSLAIIALDVVVIYALTVHGQELKE